MKILQVVSTPPLAWDTGGPARIVYEVSKKLVKLGHEVTIVTSDIMKPGLRFGSHRRTENESGVKTLRFRNLSDHLAWKHKVFISPGAAIYVRNHVREYDVVHLQDLISLQAVATSRYCRRCSVPYVLSAHGSLVWLGYSKAPSQLYGRLFGPNIIDNARFVLALTRSERLQYANLGVAAERIRLVPNGIETAQYARLPEKGRFKRKLGIREDRRVVLFLGRIHKIKGIDILVESFSRMSSIMDDAILVIAGPDDGYLTYAKSLVNAFGVEDRVLFPGPLYDEDKTEAFMDADVFVLPSEYEAFGITVLEAWACGTPVIVTERSAISDMVELAGIVVKHDASSLQIALENILKNHDLRIDLGEKGRNLVLGKFNLTEISKNLEGIYNECI